MLWFFFQEGVEAEKTAIGLLSKLRNELQTDKPVLPLTDGFPDAAQWNKYLEQQQARLGSEENTSWFKAPWLYVECYMYRRIHEALLLKWVKQLINYKNETKSHWMIHLYWTKLRADYRFCWMNLS